MTLRPAELPPDAVDEAAALLARACRFDRAAEVAEEKLLGGSPAGPSIALAARGDDGRLLGVAAGAGRWIRLLAVDPPARGRGVGTALLEALAARLVTAGAPALRTMDQPGNYLAPGVDARDDETIGWLRRRGFRPVAENENLAVPLTGNPRVGERRAAEAAEAARARGYDVRRAGAADAAALLPAVREAFSAAWAFEVERALAPPAPAGVHLAVAAGGAIAAFAAHDGNNRGLGWFGPAGTLEAHRGRGLGEALLLACLLDVAAAGHERGVIAWIGPRAFYERAAGAVADRRFVVLERAP